MLDWNSSSESSSFLGNALMSPDLSSFISQFSGQTAQHASQEIHPGRSWSILYPSTFPSALTPNLYLSTLHPSELSLSLCLSLTTLTHHTHSPSQTLSLSFSFCF